MAQIKRTDPAIIQCGSIDGSVVHFTTLTHDNLLTEINGFSSTDPFTTSDRWFSYILPEGTVEQVMGLAGSLTSGMCIDFPENQETAQQDLREVGSTIVCYPSAFWEGLAATVKDRIEKTTFVKRTISRMAASVGSRMADGKLDGRKPGVFLKAAGALAEFGFFRPLKARVGLANTRCVYAFGAELTPMAFKEMANMGLNARQLDVSGGRVDSRPTAPGKADSDGKPGTTQER
jgi:long-chain acyl-CoA synthetase